MSTRARAISTTSADPELESARELMRRLEEGDSLPTDLAAWPSGKAKCLTFGDEGDWAYGEGPTRLLGPADVELHADGTRSVRVPSRALGEAGPPARARRRRRWLRRAR